jgi:hypothetical protein
VPRIKTIAIIGAGNGGCVYRKSDSAILVMKTTEDRL